MKSMEFSVSIFFAVFSGVILWLASSMDYYSEFGPGPGLLPMWVCGIMLILSLVNAVISIKKNKTHISDFLPKGTSLVNLLACIVSYLLFVIIVPYTGFTIASVLMLFILFSRGYKWYAGFGMSIVVTGILFLVFSTILGIPLPLNRFGW